MSLRSILTILVLMFGQAVAVDIGDTYVPGLLSEGVQSVTVLVRAWAPPGYNYDSSGKAISNAGRARKDSILERIDTGFVKLMFAHLDSVDTSQGHGGNLCVSTIVDYRVTTKSGKSLSMTFDCSSQWAVLRSNERHESVRCSFDPTFHQEIREFGEAKRKLLFRQLFELRARTEREDYDRVSLAIGKGEITFVGGDGSTAEKSIVIKGAQSGGDRLIAEGIRLSDEFGTENRDWVMTAYDYVKSSKAFRVGIRNQSDDKETSRYFDADVDRPNRANPNGVVEQENR